MKVHYLLACMASILSDIRADVWTMANSEATTSLRRHLFGMAGHPVNQCSNVTSDWPYPQFNETAPQVEGPSCQMYRQIATTLLTMIRNGTDKENLRSATVDMCVSNKLASEHVCQGVVDANIEIGLYIIGERPRITEDTICGAMLQSDGCRFRDVYGTFEWSVCIDETDARPAVESKRAAERCDDSEVDDDLTIVHITDTHADPLYVVGSLAACSDPLCCRDSNDSITEPSMAAGRWGDYRSCDSPWETTIDLFEQIKAQHKKIDYIYFTGDVVDHAIWRTSFAHNAAAISRTYKALHRVFGDTPILPVIGNHEQHPANQIAPSIVEHRPDLEPTAMYNHLADSWRRWLPPAAIKTVRQFGYYTTLLRPGLRVIGLNNPDGATLNMWLLYDMHHTRRQLQWLHDTLLAAEHAGERVHLLMHLPNGIGEMMHTFSREYQRIVERFWDTIGAQFNGHTHYDEFNVFYDRATARVALNVAWNGGGANTYSNLNPNYRVYTVEQDTYQVIDHATWIFNLTAANQRPDESPVWYEEYSFREAYGVPDLAPDSLDTLLTWMSDDAELLQQYWRYKVKLADPSLAIGCDNECLATELCSLATSVADPRRKNERCKTLMRAWWENVGGRR